MTDIYIGRPWIKQITFHTLCGLIHLIEGLKWEDWESRKRKEFCLPDCFWTQDRMESCQNFQPASLLYRFQISQFLSPNSTPKDRTDSLKEISLYISPCFSFSGKPWYIPISSEIEMKSSSGLLPFLMLVILEVWQSPFHPFWLQVWGCDQGAAFFLENLHLELWDWSSSNSHIPTVATPQRLQIFFSAGILETLSILFFRRVFVCLLACLFLNLPFFY